MKSVEKGGGVVCELNHKTETELANLRMLREKFSRLVILLNVCGIIEFAEINEVGADAILLLWQGGMLGGRAAALVMTGKVNPSGRLAEMMTDYILHLGKQ